VSIRSKSSSVKQKLNLEMSAVTAKAAAGAVWLLPAIALMLFVPAGLIRFGRAGSTG
jgi:hypothetical protein